MRILSVVSFKTLERYGYAYLKEIVLRRADYQEYKISEADFKNQHPNDFEDLYLLHIQGHLNHLSGADKVHLFNVVNLWIRNIVIRKHVEDLQLEIESSYKDGDGVIVFRPRQVHYRMLILDLHIQRNHESSRICFLSFSNSDIKRLLKWTSIKVKELQEQSIQVFKIKKGMSMTVR
ncbi:hypothetical protein Tco_1361560 [Tanacetum coccineum]